MDYEKYKKTLKKFRDEKNHDHGSTTGLYAYEIKKLNKKSTLEYVEYWFEIYFSFWSSANKKKFLKDDQTLLILKNRPKSEHKDIYNSINKSLKNFGKKKNENLNFSYVGDPDLTTTSMWFLSIPAIGFPFLIWFSSFSVWIISMVCAFALAYISYLAEKNTDIVEIKSDNNPLWLLAITLASSIYWSTPITDRETFCSKQYYTSFTPTVVYEDNRYGVEDKMSVRQGSGSSCDPGTLTPIMFIMSSLLAIWFLIKSIIIFIPYYAKRGK